MATVSILYEDKNFIGFYKAPGIPTSYGEKKSCFVEEVKKEHPELFTFSGFKAEEGGLLYRLDNETEGLVLFAKTLKAFRNFVEDESLEKIYVAEVSNGESLPLSGVIQTPLVHKSQKRMATLIPGKKISYRGKPIPAQTRYEKISNSLVRCFIKKGARHQIRVHLALIGHPILGDSLYKKRTTGENDLRLACIGVRGKSLSFELDRKNWDWQSPLVRPRTGT